MKKKGKEKGNKNNNKLLNLMDNTKPNNDNNNYLDDNYFNEHPQNWLPPKRIVRNNKPLSLKGLLNMDKKSLNRFIDFCSMDEIFQMLKLNREISKLLLNTNILKSYFILRKEFVEEFKDKKNILLLKNMKNKNKENVINQKINFNKYSLNQLLKQNSSLIFKIIKKFKIPFFEATTIFSKIVEKQLKNELNKTNNNEIALTTFNFDQKGIIFLNNGLRDIENLKKIEISNNSNLLFKTINATVSLSKTSLQVLILSNNKFDDNLAINFFHNSKNFQNLKILDISFNNITQKTFKNKKAIEGLKNNFPILEKLIMNHNILGSKGAKILFDILYCKSELSLLDISYNGIDKNFFNSDEVQIFFDYNSSQKFTTFYYEGNYLPFQECNNLIQSILNNVNLIYLYLNNNQINDECMNLFSFLISNNPYIHTISLSENNFTNVGLKKFFDSIEQKTRLIEIFLAKNNLNHQSLKIISESLKNNRTISSLDLSYNDFKKDECIDYLINLIGENSRIKNLNLTSCHLGLKVKNLFEFIEKNKRLSCIDLSANNIGDNKKIFEAFANMIKNNFYLKYIYLDSNYIVDSDFEIIICDGIRFNKNLNKLSLKDNNIKLSKLVTNQGKENEKNIKESLKRNNHLKIINLNNNPLNPENFKIINVVLKENGTKKNRNYIDSLKLNN